MLYRTLVLLLAGTFELAPARAQVLTPPIFNLARHRRIEATSTCGVGVTGPELFCQLTGGNANQEAKAQLIHGQSCNFCDPDDPERSHPVEHAIDGTERWWQSPPLSRASHYNEVNLTIDMGQEFHVAYVFIRMANSPRPGVWVLERSRDHGQTFSPWAYFADTASDCETYFGAETLQPIFSDDSVRCFTQYSRVVPLEGGEIPFSLLNGRPSAGRFFNSTSLQQWTRATSVRLRLLRTKTLLGHLMSVAQQVPTITRRYFYSIKDISIGGRCVCNGHADLCDPAADQPSLLLCRCQHNTCGPQCQRCCPPFVQKQWQPASNDDFECEPCNCHGHSSECEFNGTVAELRLSKDIRGVMEGGGVCQNCLHHTAGINCDKCQDGYFRPFGVPLNATNACQLCECDVWYSTGSCAEGTGKCQCLPQFQPPDCQQCSHGHFGYPDCLPCDCHLNGTRDSVCEVGGGQCPCKQNFGGKNCFQCASSFYGFPDCLPCQCISVGAVDQLCDAVSGQCNCLNNHAGVRCHLCQHGFFDYPQCTYCNCDVTGTEPTVCDKSDGKCLCRHGYGGERCDQCAAGFYGYPDCQACGCNVEGSMSSSCSSVGKCQCLQNFAGQTCHQCSPGHFSFPDCLPCQCHPLGSDGVTCSDTGVCQCYDNFDGEKCNKCRENFYNFPMCEVCSCDPRGVTSSFAGCGSLEHLGQLCECRARVTGRSCDTCRPLFWNLQLTNPDACQECACHEAGTLGGLRACDPVSGQCQCKLHVTSRHCDQCLLGTFRLSRHNILGCQTCVCDVGGALSDVCDTSSGQCSCRPRVTGTRCSQPLQLHYFPTLFQHQYEAEDGRTPANSAVRFAYDDRQFANYSWRGYAVFSSLQREILQDIWIEKPSLYRLVLSYVNPTASVITADIRLSPDRLQDVAQQVKVRFEPNKSGSLVTATSEEGGLLTPLVLNPGRWTVVIHSRSNGLLLDFFVLIPAAYYEATILQQRAEEPCRWSSEPSEDDSAEDRVVRLPRLCVQYSYPDLGWASTVAAGAAADSSVLTVAPIGAEQSPFVKSASSDSMTEAGGLSAEVAISGSPQNFTGVSSDSFVLLEATKQPEVLLPLTVASEGDYVLVLRYMTSPGSQPPSHIDVVVTNAAGTEHSGAAVVNRCDLSVVCRQVVLDTEGRVLHFSLNASNASMLLRNNEAESVLVLSVTAIPSQQWSTDYVLPRPYCIKENGQCVEAMFTTPPHSDKVEFNTMTPEDRELTLNASTNDTVTLHRASIKIGGVVSEPGPHVIIVHYKQPYRAASEVAVLLESGRFQQASLSLSHCPFLAGCRSVVQDSRNNIVFNIDRKYTLTMEGADHEWLHLDHILVVPADLYSWELLEPLPVDRAAKFLQLCGNNHLMIDTGLTGFCRSSVFSLAAEYNNGALACGCDDRGALSFQCEPLGGQCPCRPGVIGRRCNSCRTGYFGFPHCRPCSCPSTALCDEISGECICPPRVTGDKCDRCVALSYGFDPLVGCSSCECHRLGVKDGDLQCDLETGQCPCKSNVVSRSCDRCRAGHWSFPHCADCDCLRQGTTEQVCSQETADCFCKPQVEGSTCDRCKPGAFNLDEANPDGCTRCFCFGKSDSCTSAPLFWSKLTSLDDFAWSVAGLDAVTMTVTPSVPTVEVRQDKQHVAVQFAEDTATAIVYYVAQPADSNLLTSYGARLQYSVTLHYVREEFSSHGDSGADVVLVGANITLLHYAHRDIVSLSANKFVVPLEERYFQLPSGKEASRPQLMQALSSLDAILIRALYRQKQQKSALLSALRLPRASSGSQTQSVTGPAAAAASSVEQCSCPSSYTGLSCESCAPGHYRGGAGPFGGFCVPCDCHGHSPLCDPISGVCQECQHNTTGDHCERCVTGYHGDATQGTMYDCLICACPMPIPSNNFAESCQVAGDGGGVECRCRRGYGGSQCQVCAAGHFGRPDRVNELCQPCQCSQNIDPTDPRACDPLTGQCRRCLNHTAGSSCQRCQDGYYGDAVLAKNCQACTCDRCGTHRCDPSTGRCTCKASVEGVKCDRCLPDHWGFSSCQGCSKCLCASASESTSCDLTSGQCRCRPGVTGRACDSCASGFWNYSPTGCQSCNCNSEYADGVGCNPATGQCECLPGVLGPKCDHCPPRWIFIPGEGCRECDECVHDLLDTTDGLQAVVQPIISEFQSIGGMYFMSRKLSVVNESYVGLVPQVQLLTAGGEDVNPLQLQVNDLERIAKSKEIQAENLAARAVELKSKAAKVEDEAKSVESRVKEAIDSAKNIVNDIISLAQGLQVGSGPQVSLALTEAQSLLDEIKSRDLEQIGSDIIPELVKAIDLLKRVRVLDGQVNARVEEASLLKSRFDQLMERLQDLQRQTELSRQRALETLELISNSRAVKVSQDSASAAEKSAAASILLDETEEWLRSSRKLLEATRKQLSALKLLSDRLTTTQRAMKVRYDDTGFAMEDVEDLALRAQQHAADLLIQAQMLDSMMSDTRDASEGAVRAANSYRDIVTAISEALAAAHEALSSAEKAQQLSDGVGQRANQSSEAGRAVLQEATSLLQRVSQQLQPALLTVQIELDQVKRLHDEAARQLSLIDQTFTELAQFQLQERAAAAAERATAAAQLSGQLTARVEAISSQLPLKLEAANELARETESARKALQLATEQVERVEGVVPKVQTIISSFDSKFSTIENMGRDVGDKISELRRKVAVARAKANSINVGVEFDGSVTLRLHNPDGLDLSATSNEISFFFRTSQLNGFLLYLGNEVGTNKNIIRTTSDDFVAVEVVNANINVLVDLGSGTQRVIHNKSYVSDGQWRELQISRKGRHVKVTLVSEDEKGGETTEQVESVLSGSKSALNLDQVWSVLYVGGFPVTAKVQDSVRYTSFTGAIEELRINNVPVGLWNLDSQTNIKNKGAFPRNQLVKFIPASGLRFNGAGYAAFLTQSFEFKERLSVQMSFKTFSKDGLLFLAGRGQTNFVSIELNGGALIYQFSLGDGITTLRADGFYSDGQWHVVDASRQWARGALTVDSITADQAEAAGASSELSVSSMMYFGGYPADVPYDSVMNRNFEGCINDVYVSATNLNLGSNDESLGVVPGCPDRLVSELSFEPDVPGYIVQPVEHDKIRQLSLKFRTSTADGLLVYAVSETQGSSFSLSLNAGNLVLTCVPGGEISTANFVRYNDNLWHIASISVGEDNVRLEIDDYETFTLADPYPGLLLATDSVLFFGGVPDSMRVAERRAGSVDNWAGCLGDVTFNNDFVNFELASVRHNVQLEQCSLQQAADPSQLPSSADTVGKPTLLDLESPALQSALTSSRQASTTDSSSDTSSITDISSDTSSTTDISSDSSTTTDISSDTSSTTDSSSDSSSTTDISSDTSSTTDISSDSSTTTDISSDTSSTTDSSSDSSFTTDSSSDSSSTTSPPHQHTVSSARHNLPLSIHQTQESDEAVGSTERFTEATTENGRSDLPHSVSTGLPVPEAASLYAINEPTESDLATETEQRNGRGESWQDGDNQSDGASTVSAAESDVATDSANDVSSTTSAPDPAGEVREPGCSLPVTPASLPDLAYFNGYRFGNSRDSRWEINSLPGKYSSQWSFSIDFKTRADRAVIFFASNQNLTNYIALYLKGGSLVYKFSYGENSGVVMSSSRRFNDDIWHTVDFDRAGSQGKMYVDGELETTRSSSASSQSVDVRFPVYLAGLPDSLKRDAELQVILEKVDASLAGCLRNARLNGRDFPEPSASVKVQQCSQHVESGVFFGPLGGYLKIGERFRVGLELDISMEIKPRRVGGVLVAVRGRKDFLILQIEDDGVVSLTVENGRGEMTSLFSSPANHSLCDGQWHSVRVVKVQNVVTMSVDSFTVQPVFGVPGVSSTDTSSPLFIGGVPTARMLGVTATRAFAGCLRHLVVEGRTEVDLSLADSVGDVLTHTCPTI